MDELRSILDRDNLEYFSEVNTRWAELCQKVQFYGVFKNILNSPAGMGIGKSQICYCVLNILCCARRTLRQVRCLYLISKPQIKGFNGRSGTNLLLKSQLRPRVGLSSRNACCPVHCCSSARSTASSLQGIVLSQYSKKMS